MRKLFRFRLQSLLVRIFMHFFCIEIIIQTYLIENEWTTKFFSTMYTANLFV